MSELWRYPVKSLGGEKLDSVEVTEHGINGDRRWGIRDNTTGLVLTARREPLLLLASAKSQDIDTVLIRLPDGSQTCSDSALSSWLNRDVSLVRAGEDDASYECPNDFENDSDWFTFTGPGVALHDSSSARISLVMVTRPQPGIERDISVLKTINHDRQGKLSIGALVAKPGLINLGDELFNPVVTTRS